MISFASDAWPYVGWLAAATAFFWTIGWCFLGWVAALLGAFTLFFFRDPDRDTPYDPQLAISPADGKVMRIEQIEHDDFIGGPATKVSIFLNIFNVHINRSPITGKVAFRHYRAGKMLPAYKTHASEENERNSIGIEGQAGKVIVHQITGLIARRIVCRVDTGANLAQGQRYGLIKFGSCTELIVPASATVLVSEGENVTGALTPLAKFAEAEA
jgi:phosphatidylserine decarboxylase